MPNATATDTGQQHGPHLPDAYAFIVGPATASTTNPRESWMFTSWCAQYPAAHERSAQRYFATVNRVDPSTVRTLVRWPR